MNWRESVSHVNILELLVVAACLHKHGDALVKRLQQLPGQLCALDSFFIYSEKVISHGALQRFVQGKSHTQIRKLCSVFGDTMLLRSVFPVQLRDNALMKAVIAEIRQDCTSVPKDVASAGMEGDGLHRVKAGPGPIL